MKLELSAQFYFQIENFVNTVEKLVKTTIMVIRDKQNGNWLSAIKMVYSNCIMCIQRTSGLGS